ncbi:MAG: GWxTD domain-containing protein [Saprospiraceae bacterium]|nr:GWxTD domain-containing protein [Saprospiraceae bacterium]
MKSRPFFFAMALGMMLLSARPALALDAGVSFATYATPEKPYIEINIEIAAATVTFKPIDSLSLQAGVDVLILIKSGETVVTYEKYRMSSPPVPFPKELLDVKRLFVPNGNYQLEISFQDIYDPNNQDQFTAPLEVNVTDAAVHLSGIQLLRSFRPDESEGPFNKNGYFLEPLPFSFYDRGSTKLAFYAEIYHSDKTIAAGGSYLVRYFIEKEKGNGVTALISIGNQRKAPSPIDAVLVQMDIKNLPSGNYSLTVELRNATNELLTSRKVSFQRSNPFLTIEETELTDDLVSKQFVQDLSEENLRYSLKAISPTLEGDDNETVKNLLLGGDMKSMRYFLFRHFMRRDPNNPEQSFREYMEVAGQVDQKFNTGFGRGFETARGVIYLRYGRPDDLIHVEDDPSAPPYEIWVYYNFPKTNQKNVKFLFYNPTLAGEDFILLHSTARGEINNPRWERELYKRNAGEQFQGDNYHDATEMQRNVGRNARTYFEDF